MDFGLWLDPQAPADGSLSELIDGALAQTRAAREAGFDLVMTGQHYLADYAQAQAVPLLGRIAAEAGSMTLGTGVLLLPLHHPVEVAEQLVTLDSMADGVVAGVGAGYRDVEFDAFGVPKRERAARLAEGVELMERLWTEERVTHEGRFYPVEDATITPRPDRKPPVWVAANARPAVERAARVGDAWFVNPHATVAEIREHKRAYDDARGEPGEVPVFREAFVAPTREAAVEAARPYLAAKYERYLEWGQDEAMEDADDLRRPFEDLAADRFLLGTPADVRAGIERYREELDASHVVLRMHWPGMDHGKTVEAIELLGDRVIGRV